MQSMFPAESAILFDFHSVRMRLLVLCRIVVTLLTFRTCQCDSCANRIVYAAKLALLMRIIRCAGLRRIGRHVEVIDIVSIASLGGLDEEELLNKKVAYSSNEEIVTAKYIGSKKPDEDFSFVGAST